MSAKILDRWLARNPLPGAESTKAERVYYFASMPTDVRREWELRKAKEDCSDPNYNKGLVERAQKRMARVDGLPATMREVIHEYGLEIVQEFINHRVSSPRTIAHLIDTVRGEELPNGQPRFKINKPANTPQNPCNAEPEDDGIYYIPRSQRT